VERGEIRWYTLRLPDKRRPGTIRGLTTEIVLTVDDGVPAACALNFDHVSLAQRSRIGPVLCYPSETRWTEMRDALLIVRFPKMKRLRLRKTGAVQE